jgi:hypothetical protein
MTVVVIERAANEPPESPLNLGMARQRLREVQAKQARPRLPGFLGTDSERPGPGWIRQSTRRMMWKPAGLSTT